MTWLQRYRLRHYYNNSIWILPVCAMVLAGILVRLLHWLDDAMGWRSEFNPDTMRAVLGSLAGSMFTFIVFVCSSLLLVVQLASAQLTPRMIGLLFKDPVTKLTLSMFVFTFTFAIAALVRIGSSVPHLTVEVAAYSSAGCLALFLYLIDRVSKMLRPSGALRSVCSQARQVIEDVYPRRLSDSPKASQKHTDVVRIEPPRTVASPQDGVVLAFDVKGLVVLAARSDCVIELVPQVGNFVSSGEPLFLVYGKNDIPYGSLYQSIALGEERTMEQDPTFAFRVIVDIASKGLSPAINDPTTAVLAIDQIHDLLRIVGSRNLDDERVHDQLGRVRLIYRTPDWEDFVTLAITEIRQFGGVSIQVARRLRAMLEELIQTLPEERSVPLHKELKLLQRSTERFFLEPEDRALAEISDSQGVGGKRDESRRRQGNTGVRNRLATDPYHGNMNNGSPLTLIWEEITVKTRTGSLLAGSVILALAFVGLTGQHSTGKAGEGDAKKADSADTAAIKQASQSFLKAYLAGDAKAMAAHWTENGEYFADDGTTIRGRAEIEKAYAELFAKKKTHTAAEVEITSIRFPSKDTAIEEGYFKVRTGKDAATSSKYSVLHAREDGKWLMAVVREWPSEGSSLRDLEWLIGSWEAKRDDTDVRTTYEWWGDKSFIRVNLTIKQKGQTREGFQMIGKDGSTGQLRSWTFDTEGSFAEATWSRNGNKWTQESAGVLEDGSVLAASNIVTRLDNDSFTFQSVERSVGGEDVADVPPVRVTRVKGK